MHLALDEFSCVETIEEERLSPGRDVQLHQLLRRLAS